MARIRDHLLEPGERIVLRARVHWWFNLRSFGLRNLFEPVLITDRRILEKTGILAITTRSLALDQIETRDVRQSVWGRILGFGDLEIHGSGGQVLDLREIRDPLGVARAIGRAATDRRERVDPAAPQGISPPGIAPLGIAPPAAPGPGRDRSRSARSDKATRP